MRNFRWLRDRWRRERSPASPRICAAAILIAGPYIYLAAMFYYDEASSARFGRALGKPVATVDGIFAGYRRSVVPDGEFSIGAFKDLPTGSTLAVRYTHPIDAGSIVISFDNNGKAVGGFPEY